MLVACRAISTHASSGSVHWQRAQQEVQAKARMLVDRFEVHVEPEMISQLGAKESLA